MLTALGKAIPFEIAVGANGRVWVLAGSAAQTVIVANAIANSEFITPEKVCYGPLPYGGSVRIVSDDPC